MDSDEIEDARELSMRGIAEKRLEMASALLKNEPRVPPPGEGRSEGFFWLWCLAEHSRRCADAPADREEPSMVDVLDDGHAVLGHFGEEPGLIDGLLVQGESKPASAPPSGG